MIQNVTICEAQCERLSTMFKFIHPVLAISISLFLVALVVLQGQHGPCASPLILLCPLILLGILIGAILSGIRLFRYCRARAGDSDSIAKNL